MNVNLTVADYDNQKHAEDILYLLNQYALDSAGGGRELDSYVKENLIVGLAKLPFAFSILCYLDNEAAGLVNCFTLFSTFKCKPLINIHDLAVMKQYRRQGISQLLLNEVENNR